jgi:hypothetical protein
MFPFDLPLTLAEPGRLGSTACRTLSCQEVARGGFIGLPEDVELDLVAAWALELVLAVQSRYTRTA